MGKKKVLIIGAGIAGLSAGSYLQRNGYDTEIFEAHYLPGGVCTAWKRGDYIFDYCVHWLMGTKQGTGFDTIWDELGALKNEKGEPTKICNFEEFSRIELADGDTVHLYADADKLQEELLRIAPEDEKNIRSLIKDLKKLAMVEIPVTTENWKLSDRIRFMVGNSTAFLKMIKYVRMPLGKFAGGWKSPKLQEAFNCIIPSSWSSISLLLGLAKQHVKAAGYPVGGSLPFAHNIEREYLALGGKIHYSSMVEKILVKDDRAVGIKLNNGEEIFGDDIVSAADGYSTLYKMLDGRYLSPQVKKAYEDFSLFPSSVYLGFGVAKDLSDLPHAINLHLSETLILPDDSQHQHISLNVYHFDPTLAPTGKTSVTVLINTWNGDYWKDLAKKDPKAYKEIKSQIAENVLNILDDKFPGFKSAVEVINISTPHTVQRYTGNWHGSYEGFAATPAALMTKLPKEVIGLKNCHMIGHWTEPGGGIPPAALDGRNLARKLCKRDSKQFIGQHTY
ncbi:MAG: NAD(P)/FAD-dependent oxidoreductase [Clostridiaceae bacterium]|nr:NAD(P)/FAD-dependent oxidoreductase [Clostridiaceae bacterium]